MVNAFNFGLISGYMQCCNIHNNVVLALKENANEIFTSRHDENF